MSGDRYLVLLQPTRANVDGDSLSRHMLDFVHETCSRGNFVYLACQTTINDEMVRLPPLPSRCLRVQVSARCGDSIMQGRAAIDTVELAKMFSRDFGRYPIDAVVALIYAPAQALTLGLAASPNSWGPPLIRIDPGTDLTPNDLTTRHLVHSGCQPNVKTVVLSAPERDLWAKLARGLDLTSSQRGVFDQNLYTAPVKLDLAAISAHGFHKQYDPTLLYAGRANAVKQTQKILNAYADLWKGGAPVKIRFLTQDENWGKFTNFAEHPFVERQTKVTRDQFYAAAAQSHIFLNWSDSESFHASFREAALLGNVCLSVDSKPMRALFGDALPERFWFKDNHGSAVNAIKEVLADIDKARYEFGPFLTWVREQNKQPSLAERVETLTADTLRHSTSLGPRELFVLDPAKWPVFDNLMREFKARKESKWALSDIMVSLKELFPPLEKYASAFSPWHLRNVLKFHYHLADDCATRFPAFDLSTLHLSAQE